MTEPPRKRVFAPASVHWNKDGVSVNEVHVCVCGGGGFSAWASVGQH